MESRGCRTRKPLVLKPSDDEGNSDHVSERFVRYSDAVFTLPARRARLAQPDRDGADDVVAGTATRRRANAS
jgi:hypothetical protein